MTVPLSSKNSKKLTKKEEKRKIKEEKSKKCNLSDHLSEIFFSPLTLTLTLTHCKYPFDPKLTFFS